MQVIIWYYNNILYHLASYVMSTYKKFCYCIATIIAPTATHTVHNGKPHNAYNFPLQMQFCLRFRLDSDLQRQSAKPQ